MNSKPFWSAAGSEAPRRFSSGTGVLPVRFKIAGLFGNRNSQASRLCHYRNGNFRND
jgi:hypothetical protein